MRPAEKAAYDAMRAGVVWVRWKQIGVLTKGRRKGQKVYELDCPFCGNYVTTNGFVLSGGGKRCSRCKAKLTQKEAAPGDLYDAYLDVKAGIHAERRAVARASRGQQ